MTAAGSFDENPEARLIVPNGARILSISVMATNVDVELTIGSGQGIVVPAGTTFSLGGNEFPERLRQTIITLVPTATDADSRYAITWSIRE